MAYTKVGPFVDGSGSPSISAAFLNNVETALTGAAAAYAAPAPSGDTSGATDQAALQGLITSVQAAGGGTITLLAGTYYVTGLVTTNTTVQPRIVGQGRRATVLRAAGTGTVLRFRGTPGTITGGAFESLTIYGSGIGVEIAGAGGVKWRQVVFDGPLTEGIRFNNETTSDYTEFCSGDAEFTTALHGPAVRYKLGTGDKSFHGSGLTEGSIINQPSTATWPVIQIDAGCLPYNAPMTVQIFARATTALVKNSNTTDYVNFRGQLTVEQFTANCTIFDTTGAAVWYSGSLNAYGNTGLTVGNVNFVDRIWTPASSAYPEFVRRPWATNTTLAAGTTALATFDQRSNYMVSVRISDSLGTVYYYDQLLYVVLNAHVGTGAGFQPILATTRSTDTGTLGAPVYAVTSNQLTVTNAGYSSSLTAQVGITPILPWVPLT